MRNNIIYVMALFIIAMPIFVGCTGPASDSEEPVAEEQTATQSQNPQAENHEADNDLSTESDEPVRGIEVDILAGFPSEEVTPEEKNALGQALYHEYMKRAIYQKALDTFGDVRPFSGIYASTGEHVEALITLFGKYNLDVLNDDWFERTPEFDTLSAAYESCQAMEMSSGVVYDELISSVDNEDIRYIFTSIRRVAIGFNAPELQRYIEGRIE